MILTNNMLWLWLNILKSVNLWYYDFVIINYYLAIYEMGQEINENHGIIFKPIFLTSKMLYCIVTVTVTITFILTNISDDPYILSFKD
jgi:hypothetical protein